MSFYLILGNPRLHMQAREAVGRRGRETEKAGRQTGIRTKGGEESGRKYQLRTDVERKKREVKRFAKRRSTHKSKNYRGEKLQTGSGILIVFGSCEGEKKEVFLANFYTGKLIKKKERKKCESD